MFAGKEMHKQIGFLEKVAGRMKTGGLLVFWEEIDFGNG